MAKKLQVFISSTYSDLKQERQAAVSAILKSGHIPAGMELFTSGDQSQLDTIKAWIDESDIYMLILGGRYGSIEPASKKSYTELEFEYAASKNKPMFSVVITEAALERKVQAGGTAFIEMKNGVALDNFRAKVLTYISSFFDDEKDIKLTVYESLADFAANKDLIGWVPGNTVVDTVPLFDEIKKLSEENIALRSTLSELERRAKKESGPYEEFKLLMNVLKAEMIEVPKSVNKDGPFKLSLFNLLLQTQTGFASGIENSHGMNVTDEFLFFTVGPRLQIHGLVHNEKIAGVRYRRCALTQQGEKFLSQVAKMKIENTASVAAKAANTPEEPNTQAHTADEKAQPADTIVQAAGPKDDSLKKTSRKPRRNKDVQDGVA
jgi:hypothetical protein